MKKYLFFALLSLFSCNELKKTKLSGFVFGTSYSIQFYTSSNSNYSNEIINIFNDIDISMSTYNKKSIISKVNNNQNVILDSHFQNVFHSSKKIYELTDGRFDPSIGLFVNYWGFGPEKFMIDPEIKKGDPLSYLFSKTGMDKFKIIDDKLIRPNDSYIDFNAIAKGYAVDVIGQFLKDKQIDNYLIEIGGEIKTLGTNINKNKPWIVAIDMPCMRTYHIW